MKTMRLVLLLSFLMFPAAAADSLGAVAAGMTDFRQVIADAKREVFPAVVFLMPIAERFEGGKSERAQVAGSGVIISPEGEIVTNWHVVDRALEIRCSLYDGRAYRASVIGVDKDTDLALLKIDAPAGSRFPAAALGSSGSLEEGQVVMAMGAPWGLSRSVSMGILSCVNRFLPGQGGGYNLWLQTDASINPGNSGGPLVDTSGRVVGINSLGSLLGGNLAFAIPSDTVRAVADRLRRDGRVVRAWTGIHLQPLKDFEKNIFYEGETGALVAGVDPGSPADKAGIAAGQLLLSVNGREVRGINHEDIPGVNRLLAELPVGEQAVLTLRPSAQRADEGAVRSATFAPMEKGRVEGDDFDCRRWNMTVKAINEFATPTLHFFQPRGIYIQGVKHPGNATSAGLKPGDIILEMDGVPVEGMGKFQEMYRTIIGDAARDKKVIFTVMRAGLKNYHVLDYAPLYGQE